MIRINLIPAKRKKKKKAKPIPKFLVALVFLTAGVIVLILYTLFMLKSQISALEAKKEENIRKIAELKDKIKEVSRFEELNKIFTDRKNIIEQLRKNQSIPVKVLDEMSSRLTEGVWLNVMSITGADISIEGEGFTNSDIVRFVQNLKDSTLFMDVYLNEAKQVVKEQVEVYTFSISLKLKA